MAPRRSSDELQTGVRLLAVVCALSLLGGPVAVAEAQEPNLQVLFTTVLDSPAGDADDSVEPGEAFLLGVRLENQGNAAATNVSATITETNPHLSFSQATAQFADIAPNGGQAGNTTPFAGALAAAAGCDSGPLALALEVDTDQGHFTVPFELLIGQAGSTVADSTATQVAIPDNTPGGATSTINVTRGGTVPPDVKVRLTITHTFDADLVLSLRSPSGSTVVLSDHRGGAGDNYTNTYFTDLADGPISAGNPPFSGTFRPESPLGASVGEPRNGAWILRAVDTGAGATGTVRNWDLQWPQRVCSTPALSSSLHFGSGWSAAGSSAKGDFNGDGFGDLAVGAPGEDSGAGMVHVIHGSESGLQGADAQIWSQASDGIAGDPEPGDGFGSALAAGDFDGDGRDELAIGVPGEDWNTGLVHVFPGSAAGLTSAGSVAWTRGYPRGDGFGISLAAGDFGKTPHADLAVGAPGDDGGNGAVWAFYGTESGLDTANTLRWWQGSTNVPGSPERGDAFGTAVAAADLGGTAQDELVIGIPGEDARAGGVTVLPGSIDGLTAVGSQLWNQDSPGIPGGAEPGDHFGNALAAGNLGVTSTADLAVGAPGENAGEGVAHVLYSDGRELTADGTQLLSQSSQFMADDPEGGDRFGASLAAADFFGQQWQELVIGVPFENDGAGALHILSGTPSGVTAGGSRFWTQAIQGIHDSPEPGDHFATELYTADFGRGVKADLVVGVPGENAGAGVVHAMYGASAGLTPTGSQVWSQASTGILDSPEPRDGFGAAAGR